MVKLREPELKKEYRLRRIFFLQRSGGNSGEDPPVPIPNTEVKLSSAEDTWRATARENMTLPV